MKTSIILAALCALTFAACTKETPVSNTAAKLRGKWKISACKRTAFYFFTQRDSAANFLPQLKACYKDDLLTLQEGFGGNVFYGAVSCTVMEPQTNPISWQTRQNDSLLEVNGAKQFFFGANPMSGQLIGDASGTFTVRYETTEMDIDSSNPDVVRGNAKLVPVTYENTYTRQ